MSVRCERKNQETHKQKRRLKTANSYERKKFRGKVQDTKEMKENKAALMRAESANSDEIENQSMSQKNKEVHI